MNEIKFIDEPHMFKEVSCKIKTLLISNNHVNISFADQVELDYEYSQSLEISTDKLNNIFLQKKYDLLILDVHDKKEGNIVGILRNISEVFEQLNELYDKVVYSFIISPFKCNYCEKGHEEIIKDQLKDNLVVEQIKKIIPIQSWQYNCGEVDNMLKSSQQKI